MRLQSSLFIIAAMATGCAKSTAEIPAQYVSSLQYEGYSCKQLRKEAATISRRASEIGAGVDKVAEDDGAQTGIGIILFWPALFFLDGDTPQAAEYARLKGEMKAVEDVANYKNCDFEIEPIYVKPVKTESDSAPRIRR